MDKALTRVKATDSRGSGAGVAFESEPRISAAILRAKRDEYFLIDVRGEEDEAEEAAGAMGGLEADMRIGVGRLVRDAAHGKLDHLKGRKVATLCNIGYRSGIACRELNRWGFSAFSVERGQLALESAAAVRPEFLVLLAQKHSAEKITIALSAAAVSQASGKQTVLCLMSDGVTVFRKAGVKDPQEPEGLRLEDIDLGAPYKPPMAALRTFLDNGGVVLGCKSCMVHRGYEYGNHVLDCVVPMQMPDMLRMLDEASKSLQFA